jgi:hypothetical protein
VPEWSSSYINYKGLKKLIKAAVATGKAGKDVDLAGKLPILVSMVEPVANFDSQQSSSSPWTETSKMSTNSTTKSLEMLHGV